MKGRAAPGVAFWPWPSMYRGPVAGSLSGSLKKSLLFLATAVHCSLCFCTLYCMQAVPPCQPFPPGYSVSRCNVLVSIASPPHSGRPAACVVIPGVHAFLLPSVASHSRPEGVLQHGSPWPIEGYRPVRFRFLIRFGNAFCFPECLSVPRLFHD